MSTPTCPPHPHLQCLHRSDVTISYSCRTVYIIDNFLSFGILHVQYMGSVMLLHTFFPTAQRLIFLRGNLFITPLSKQVSKWLRITEVLKSQNTGDCWYTSSVANAIANNPQSLRFVWCCTFRTSQMNWASFGLTRLQICFFVSRLMLVLRLS